MAKIRLSLLVFSWADFKVSKQMAKFNSVKTSMFVLFLFVFLASFGTILHEFGHYLPAKILGFEPKLHYGSTSFNSLIGFTNFKMIIVYFSGPLMNMLIGSIGFYILFKSDRCKSVDILSLVFASITFFWSRQVVVFILDLIMPIFNKKGLINKYSDEENLSNLLNLHKEFFSILFGILGVFFCFYTVFFLIKKRLRLPFIFFGILGSSLGIYLWYFIVGPFLLP